MRSLVVVDLSGSERIQRLCRMASQAACWLIVARWRFARLLGLSKSGLELTVLVISPGGSVRRADWPQDCVLLTPTSVVPRPDQDELHEAVFEAVARITQGEGAELFPTVDGVNLGLLNRVALAQYLRRALLLTRAVDLAARSSLAAGVSVFTLDLSIARMIRRALRERGKRVRIWLPRLYSAFSHVRGMSFGGGSANANSVGSRIDTSAALSRLGVSASDVEMLLVSESTPMSLMFDAIEAEIEGQEFPNTVRIQHGKPQHGPRPNSRVTLCMAERPDSVVPAGYGRYRAAVNRSIRLSRRLNLTQRLGDSSYTLDLEGILQALYRTSLDQQAEHVMAVARLLDSHAPGAVAVGNDRWWIGQTYCLQARRRGIPTVMIQDGLATGGAEWFWMTADAAILNSDVLRRCLLEHGVAEERMSVAGQPRYDEICRRLRMEPPVSVRHGDRAVLVATQTLQDKVYVNELVEAILAVPGVKILLRPHPSEDHSGHRELERRHPRVEFDDSPDVFATLRRCDVVVCQSSTVVLEAALLEVPAITANFTGLPDLAAYAQFGTAIAANSPEAVRDAVARVLAEGWGGADSEAARLRSEGLRALLGPIDGGASARVVAALRSVLASRPQSSQASSVST